MNNITIRHLYKVIKEKTILDDINLQLTQEHIHLLVGENGSGKTMLIRALAGLVIPTKGEILFDGCSRSEADPTIGIMIEHASLYPDFTAMENLELLAGIRRRVKRKQIMESIERVGLDPKDKTIFSKYSLGMKQRLLLAQAIMELPEVLLLDEPTNAIDKEGRILFYRILQEEHKRGALILATTHSEQDINTINGQIIKIEQGRIIS